MEEAQTATVPVQGPPTIWSALEEWWNTLPDWQRFIVGIATAKGRLSDDEVTAAYIRFLQAKGLRPKDDTIPGATFARRPSTTLAANLALTKVDGLAGINALPAGAELTFGPALTVIYGRNGAGKSGFARLFANACFSRQRPAIIPDIYVEGAAPGPAAQFHVSVGDVPQPPITYSHTDPDTELKRITVFDAAVARHHITQAAAFEFKPAGFDVFPELARVYGALAERLDAEIAARSKQNEFPKAFIGSGTAVHTLVDGLSADTDLEAVRKLAKYGDAEHARMSDLDRQILALRTKSPKEVLAALREAAEDVQTLGTQIVGLGVHFAGEATNLRAKTIQTAKEAVVVAAAAGADQFKRSFFAAVGTPEWEAFAEGAHALAQVEHEDYPAADSHCLLCERPFDEPSRKHVEALLAFVEGDARKAAEKSRGEVSAAAAALARLDLNIFAPASRVRTHVRKLDPDLEPIVEAARVSILTARDAGIADSKAFTATAKPVDVTALVSRLEALSNQIAADIARLEGDNTDAAIVSLDLERRTLRHRQVLSGLLANIETFVTDAGWARKATTARASLGTRQITDKEKEMFASVVGDGYRTNLAKECGRLECDVPIELQTVGRSGQTLRSLAMRGGHKPEAILSEGEQRAVALADFLTEVSLNPASAGIVFDDPVTSQDHQRKEKIAQRLAEESTARQVIVFTHDLVFLNQLSNAAEVVGCDVVAHWIDRDTDGRPGRVALGDSPVTSRAYETTKRAEDALARAKTSNGTDREDAIRKGIGALRTTLEETVVRKVFKEAVPRWSDQVRVTTLRRVNWDNGKIDEICELYEDLSRFIEGHSHTDEATGAPPQTTDLETRIAQVKELLKWAKSDRPKG